MTAALPLPRGVACPPLTGRCAPVEARVVRRPLADMGPSYHPLCAGPVILQPPSEDRVSAFVSFDGCKPTCLKFFSTGKVRCLKSDYPNAEEAQKSAQSLIDEMASSVDAGMPPIRLRDAKFNENSKDYTWSTRQNIDIRRLSAALRAVNIKAESDTSFGDSIMVIITPTGTNRQIKGQVLADGTIRLAGCRDDGELAAHAVATSLNKSGALQGGPVDLSCVSCEVWLTKRSFNVCSDQQTINMDNLYLVLNDARLRHCHHPLLSIWLREKGDCQFIKSINKVGTACPRLEVKFTPLVIDEWEQTRRCKPEPVSISIHHKGEVQLAGNAEYKVMQAVYYLTDIFNRHSANLIDTDEGSVAHSSRTPKRKLEVLTSNEGSESESIMTPTTMSLKKARTKTETPATAVRGSKKAEVVRPAVSNWLPEVASPHVDAEVSAQEYHERQLVVLALLRLCQEGSMPWDASQSAPSSSQPEDVSECVRANRPEESNLLREAVRSTQEAEDEAIASAALASMASPNACKKYLPKLDVEDRACAGNLSGMHSTCSATGEVESPPVSPTGNGAASSSLDISNTDGGRSTPVSPAKGPSKVRGKYKLATFKPDPAPEMRAMASYPQHMAMQSTQGQQPVQQALWMPHTWAPAPYPSPWITSLTNTPPTMHTQKQ